MISNDDQRATSGEPFEAGEPDSHESGEPSTGPVTATELLRTALVDDQDPRFPRWLPVPGVLLGLAWAAYQATAGDAGVLPTIGISLAIAAGTTVATWLGWQLEID